MTYWGICMPSKRERVPKVAAMDAKARKATASAMAQKCKTQWWSLFSIFPSPLWDRVGERGEVNTAAEFTASSPGGAS